MKRISTSIFFCLSFIMLLSSCASQKKAIKQPLKEKGEDYLLSKMKENQSSFETFSGKALVEIVSKGKSNNLKVNIRIRRDSAIWVSISAGVGLEAARILLTKDSVMYLNRLNNSFFVGNYEFVNQLIHAKVDFDIVQALLTGNDFKWYDYQDLEASTNGNQYQLESAHRRKLKKYLKKSDAMSHIDQVIYQSMWLNPTTFKIERIKIKEIENENKKINAEYGNFKTFGNQLLPTQYNMTISAQDDVDIDATFMKIILDKKLKFPFHIPSKYQEIEIQ